MRDEKTWKDCSVCSSDVQLQKLPAAHALIPRIVGCI